MLAELLTRSVWLTLGSAVGRLMPLTVLIWTSRHFDASQFASGSAGFAWAGVAMSLTSTGEATVMTQRLASQLDSFVRRGLFVRHTGRALLFSAGLAFVVMAVGESGVRNLFGGAVSGGVIAPAALAGVWWALVVLCVAALNGCHAPRRASATLAVCGLLQGSAMAVAIVVFGTAEGMVCGLAAGSGAASVVALLQVRATLGPLWRDRAPSAAAARRSVGDVSLARNPVLWNTLAAVSVLPVMFFASSLVAKGPGGTRQLAQFFALEQIHQVLVYIPAILGQAFLPMITRRISTLDNRAARHELMQRIAKVTVVAAVAGIGLALLIGLQAQWLVWLLGNAALDVTDAPAIQAMMVNASLALSLSLLGGAFVGSGHIVMAAVFNLIWGGLVVMLTMIWIEHGNLGLQAARVSASLALLMLALPFLWRYTQWADRPRGRS